ncbi:hypothetical protein PG985_005894 [Apiospora marii]|uniref:C2H2-type domain-containing protein n=1 Tax=Apiospora marii TaxID=335849 RepID=A0ABR1SBY3_9PEZI
MWAADIGEPAHHTPPDNAILFDRNSQDTLRDTLSSLCQQLEECKSYSRDMGMNESPEDSQTTPPTRGDDGPEADLLEKAKGDVESLLDELTGIVADCRARYASRLDDADSQFEPELYTELERHLEAKLVDQGPSSSHTDPKSRYQLTSELSEIQKRLVNANLRRRNRFLFARQQYGGLDPIPNAPGATTIPITKSAPFLLFAAADSPIPRVEPPYYYPFPVWNYDREHMDLDIRPYTCFLPDCPNPDQLFATKELWESHGQRCHKVKKYYVCTLCRGCPVIPDEAAWKAHTREAHRRGWPETRIPALMRRSKQCMPTELDA